MIRNILIAPNAFKYSLNSIEVAESIFRGLKSSLLKGNFKMFPIADGGNGTGKLITNLKRGRNEFVWVRGPKGEKILSSFGVIDKGKTGVVELSEASGLHLLETSELDPLKTNTLGVGDLIINALDLGIENLILTLGGSSSIDAGTGILRVLGVRFLNSLGEDISEGLPSRLLELDSIDVNGIDSRIRNCNITVLCDVKNTILGDFGCIPVFGPQKGLNSNSSILLKKGLTRFCEVVESTFGKKVNSLQYGGAAGGVAAGLYGVLGAKLVSGIDYFLDITGFDKILHEFDLLITAEGRIDSQTLEGKGPFEVASRAKIRGIPTIGLGGSINFENKKLYKYFDSLFPINFELEELREAYKNTSRNLNNISRTIGNLIHSCNLTFES